MTDEEHFRMVSNALSQKNAYLPKAKVCKPPPPPREPYAGPPPICEIIPHPPIVYIGETLDVECLACYPKYAHGVDVASDFTYPPDWDFVDPPSVTNCVTAWGSFDVGTSTGPKKVRVTYTWPDDTTCTAVCLVIVKPPP